MNRFVLLLLLPLLAVPAFADKIYLDSGEVVAGTIVSEDDARIVMCTQQGREEIYRPFIARIVRTAVTAGVTDPPLEEFGGASGGSAAFEPLSSHTGIKFSIDSNGRHRAHGSLNNGGSSRPLDASGDVKSAFSVSGEHVTFVSQNLGLGFGLTYQLPRELRATPGKFNFIPVYGLLKVRSSPVSGDYAYGLGQFGYNFFSGDSDYAGPYASLSDGLYYGAGGGIVIGGRMQIEALYAVNTGSITDTRAGYSISKSIEYSKLLISVGLAF